VKDLEKEMQSAAKAWDFERAALLRDEIMELKSGAGPKDLPSPKMQEAMEHVEEKVGPRKGVLQTARHIAERKAMDEFGAGTDETSTGDHADKEAKPKKRPPRPKGA